MYSFLQLSFPGHSNLTLMFIISQSRASIRWTWYFIKNCLSVYPRSILQSIHKMTYTQLLKSLVPVIFFKKLYFYFIIKMIKSDSKDLHCLNKRSTFALSIHQIIYQRKITLITVFKMYNNVNCFFSSKSVYKNDFWRIM